ncbi:hypothetical protein BQ8794_50306 [Mesorhizobium prunaredense]|uniref:Uncharacterized protein n=1 Tax=Mesorhizobium prunaredense TaxID=1631249 RepID=A0A1R3VEF6_9HYPH|nr:hypothetical protein BQ8794_50306 [Mesorhizobium prunaredense]
MGLDARSLRGGFSEWKKRGNIVAERPRTARLDDRHHRFCRSVTSFPAEGSGRCAMERLTGSAGPEHIRLRVLIEIP